MLFVKKVSEETNIIYDNNILKVNAQEEGIADIIISNMNGQPIAQWKQYLNQNWNDITDMPMNWHRQTSGMYIVSIYQSGLIYSGKIIKY